MNIREILKSNPLMRKIGKKYYIRSQFKDDAKNFKKYYCEEAERSGDYRYSIMLVVHSLEKGMCMPNPRPFGNDKVKKLLNMLESGNNKDCFEYNLGVSIIFQWVDFYKRHGWEQTEIVQKSIQFLQDKEATLKAGCQKYISSLSPNSSAEFEKVVMTRHSVRDFQQRKLDMKDVELAKRCFVETPTACNRQMCRLLYISDENVKKLLDKVIIGLPGFNKDTVQYFVVTYDLAAFAYSGERQQGMFNSGLCTMNFVNGLHAKGIGSCCLQWSNKRKDDISVRKALGIKQSERIAVVVAAGYYLESNTIPCSVRRDINEVFQVI